MRSGISLSLGDGDPTFAMKQELQWAQMGDRLYLVITHSSEAPLSEDLLCCHKALLSPVWPDPENQAHFSCGTCDSARADAGDSPMQNCCHAVSTPEKAQAAFATEILLSLPNKTQATWQNPAFSTPLAASMTSMLLWMWKCPCVPGSLPAPQHEDVNKPLFTQHLLKDIRVQSRVELPKETSPAVQCPL